MIYVEWAYFHISSFLSTEICDIYGNILLSIVRLCKLYIQNWSFTSGPTVHSFLVSNNRLFNYCYTFLHVIMI